MCLCEIELRRNCIFGWIFPRSWWAAALSLSFAHSLTVYWFICLNHWTKKSVERKWSKIVENVVFGPSSPMFSINAIKMYELMAIAALETHMTPPKNFLHRIGVVEATCVCVCVHAVCGVVAPAFFPFFHSFCFFILFSGFVFVSNLFYGGEYISKYLSMLLLILCGIFSHEWLPLLFLIMRIIILHHSSRKCAAHAYNCTLLWRNMEYGTV